VKRRLTTGAQLGKLPHKKNMLARSKAWSGCGVARPAHRDYWLLTTALDVPFEFVSVTVTAITSAEGPFAVVNGTVSWNSLPVAFDVGFEYTERTPAPATRSHRWWPAWRCSKARNEIVLSSYRAWSRIPSPPR
jgi:hypothetical protein